MENKEIECIIEGILFASGEPVSINRIALVLDLLPEEVEERARTMADKYNFDRRGISLVILGDKLQLCTRGEYAGYIRKALETRKPPTLSQASLEVLAIVAYRQPVTRAYVEQVRGVDSSGTMSMLAEKGLIEECGRLEVPGRPMLFRTTPNFLRSFGLENISQLPDLEAESDGQLTFAEDILKTEEPSEEQ